MLTVDDVQTIGALFNLERWTLTPSAGDGGTIAPTGVVTVDHGSGQTFTITPSDGYHVADVLVDGVSVGAVTSHTFTDVTADHTIQAVFETDVTFAASDLAGEWRLAGIAAGEEATSPYGIIEFNADARATGGLLTYPAREAQELIEGGLLVESQGLLTDGGWVLQSDRGLTVRSGIVTEGKNFLTLIGQSTSGHPEWMTAMKSGTAIYPEPAVDLSGTWHLLGFRTGDGDGPFRGTLTLDAAGQVAEKSSLMFPNKTLTLIEGSLTKGLDASLDILMLNSGQIDSGRTLMSWTDAGKSAHDFFLAIKDGGAFPQGFLEGTWYVTGVSAGTTWRGQLAMTGQGIVTGGNLFDVVNGEERETIISGGAISMNAAGVISNSTLTLAGDVLLIERGKMTADKNMIVWIMETPGETPGLIILTRGRDQR
jgi:hypothetical protein